MSKKVLQALESKITRILGALYIAQEIVRDRDVTVDNVIVGEQIEAAAMHAFNALSLLSGDEPELYRLATDGSEKALGLEYYVSDAIETARQAMLAARSLGPRPRVGETESEIRAASEHLERARYIVDPAAYAPNGRPAQRLRMAVRVKAIEQDVERHRRIVEVRLHHPYTSGVD